MSVLTHAPLLVAAPAVFSHTCKDYPREAVGLIWNDGTVSPLTNRSEKPNQFDVTASEIIGVVEQQPIELDLFALYHSHPNGGHKPSATDLEMMEKMFEVGIEIPWLIVTSDHLYIWYWEPQQRRAINMTEEALYG